MTMTILLATDFAGDELTQWLTALRSALPGETLSELSARTHNQWDLTFTSVANGVFAHDALKPGQRIKIAVMEPYQPAPGAAPVPANPPAPVASQDHAAN